jgi:hypothetical protein
VSTTSCSATVTAAAPSNSRTMGSRSWSAALASTPGDGGSEISFRPCCSSRLAAWAAVSPTGSVVVVVVPTDRASFGRRTDDQRQRS